MDQSQRSHRSHTRSQITTNTAYRNRREEALSQLDKTQYEDDDDDDEEFDDADEDEEDDNHAFLVARDFENTDRPGNNKMFKSGITNDELDDATSQASHQTYKSRKSQGRFRGYIANNLRDDESRRRPAD